MASSRKRIPLSGSQTGLNNAFASLKIEGLPEGPEQVGAQTDASKSGGVELGGHKPGRVVVRRLTAHRGGKTVLLVDGFGGQHDGAAIEALGRRLRAKLGCGGNCRDRVLEIQGDQTARLRLLLEGEGFLVVGER